MDLTQYTSAILGVITARLYLALARHSTINLTMNVYSRVDLDEKAKTVASIPDPTKRQSDAQRQSSEDDEDGGRGAKVAEPTFGPWPVSTSGGNLDLT